MSGNEFKFSGYILNEGNRSAVILKTSMYMNVGDGTLTSRPESAAIIKPGGADLRKFGQEMESVYQSIYTESAPTEFGAAVKMLSPDGRVIDRKIRLGTLDIVKDNESGMPLSVSIDGYNDMKVLIDVDNLKTIIGRKNISSTIK